RIDHLWHHGDELYFTYAVFNTNTKIRESSIIQKVNVTTHVTTELYNAGNADIGFFIQDSTIYMHRITFSGELKAISEIWRMTVGGKSRTLLFSTEGIIDNINFHNGKIYYQNFSTLRVFDPKSKADKAILDGVPKYNMMGNAIYYGDYDGNIKKFDIDAGTVETLFRGKPENAICCISVSNDDLYFAVGNVPSISRLSISTGTIETYEGVYQSPMALYPCDNLLIYSISDNPVVVGYGEYMVLAKDRSLAPQELPDSLLGMNSNALVPTSLIFDGIDYNKSASIRISLDNKQLSFDVPPQVVKGRTLVPFRALFEALGMSVEWDATKNTAIGVKGTGRIEMPIGGTVAMVNGIPHKLDVPATVVSERTLVPLRFVSEALGYNVVWVGNSNLILVSEKDIVEWRFGGHEASAPHKEYQTKFVNGEQTKDTRYTGTTWVPPTHKPTSPANIFKLSDEAIANAIAEGEKGFAYVSNIYKSTYSLHTSVESSYDMFVDRVTVETPYMTIMQQSAIKISGYEKLSLADAKKIATAYSDGSIMLGVRYNLPSLEAPSLVRFVIKQGNNVFHPQFVGGQDELPDMTSSWPNFPAYQATLTPSFNNSTNETKIDLSKPAELIVVHAPEIESRYILDFSSLK
ncbi:MAG: stalk domain-containing protein, partial [Christensenellaceae bacterium]